MSHINVTSIDQIKKYPDGRLYGRRKGLMNLMRGFDLNNKPALSPADIENYRDEMRNIEEEIKRRQR